MRESVRPWEAPAPPRADAPHVSVVIPVFNEEESLPELQGRVVRALDSLRTRWELIYVDDGSRDRSLELLTSYAQRTPGVRVVEFNRNYGQHAAVLAGMAESGGDIVVTLDADLQNPPEEIPKLVAKIDEGFDVVGSRRASRRDSAFRRLASRLANRLTGGAMSDYGCMLRAYRREIVDQIGRCREIRTFIPVLANLFARRVVEIDVDHAPRAKGASKYGLLKLVGLQMDLMTGFSTLPLRLLTWFGFLVAAAATGLGGFLLLMRLLKGSEWAQFGVFTLFAVLFLMVGFLFVGLGVIGEYVGRIYSEVRSRPRYVVRRVHGSGGREGAP